MIWRCHSIPSFHFYFLFRNNGNREQLDENDFRRCYSDFFSKMSFWKYFITAMFKVFSQQLRGTLTTAFERGFTIEDFTDMDQHSCWACSKTFGLLLYTSLSLKQSLVLKSNLVLIEKILSQFIYLSTFWYFVHILYVYMFFTRTSKILIKLNVVFFEDL